MSSRLPAHNTYGAEVLKLLWPDAVHEHHLLPRKARGAAQRRQWLTIPNTRGARMLLPTGVPAAAQMLGRSGGSRRVMVRALGAALTRAVAADQAHHLPLARISVTSPRADDSSIAGYLAEVLGEPVDIGVLLGTPRANRKPVLQVFDHAGRTRAYVKVGHNPLARSLVRQETANLAAVAKASLQHLRVPDVLHSTDWRELALLVLSPLGASGHPQARRGLPAEAMLELSRTGGSLRLRLTDSPLWTTLRDDVEAPPELEKALAVLSEVHGDTILEFGSWHGDWTPWNMHRTGTLVELWDWERFERGVPIGFDALHFRIQAVRHDSPQAREQESAFLADAPGILAAMDVPADRAQLTLILYLMAIAHRYLHDSDRDPLSPLMPRTRWVLSFLQREIDRLCQTGNGEGSRP